MGGAQQQRKGRWTKDEDNMLKNFVTTNNVNGGDDIDWSTLEQEFNGTRDSKQIRERWVNHLNPTIKKRKFSDDEKKIIDEECSKHKFKWAKIAKKIPNATPLMIKNYYNNRLKKKNPTNRKPNNLNTVSYNTTTYTINNFNNDTTTTTTTTTLNITNNNLNSYNNNSNHNHNYNNEYHLENDISYYKEPNLSRSSSSRTDRTAVESSLSRNSSIRSVNSERSERTMVSSSLPSPPLSSGLPDEKLVTLATIATIADRFSQAEKTKFPTDPPIKSKIMSISSLIS